MKGYAKKRLAAALFADHVPAYQLNSSKFRLYGTL